MIGSMTDEKALTLPSRFWGTRESKSGAGVIDDRPSMIDGGKVNQEAMTWNKLNARGKVMLAGLMICETIVLTVPLKFLVGGVWSRDRLHDMGVPRGARFVAGVFSGGRGGWSAHWR
jgi:hypothetical protein